MGERITIGDVAPDFVVALARMNQQLKSVFFRVYTPIPGVHERVANARNRPAKEIVADFLRHENRCGVSFEVLTRELTAEVIRGRMVKLQDHQALAFDARAVTHDGAERYFPMMDFKAPSNADNLILINSFLEGIGIDGILVDSGLSYHFYGFAVMNYREWVAFMGKCLLAQWADSRWIGHSLLEGGGDLRISPTKLKPKLPSVVGFVEASS